MLLVVPLLYAVYLAWDIYGPRRQRAFVQVSLFALSLLLLPLNTVHGLHSTDWSVEPRRAMLSDLNRTVSDFANRHHRFLAHMVPVQDLAASIRMLREARRWPFTQLRDDAREPRAPGFDGQGRLPIESPQTTVRYTLAGATDAIMVWGINGWQPLSGEPPQGTILDGGVMQTPMSGSGGRFVVSVPAPAGAKIQFGFLSRDRRRSLGLPSVWDGDENYQTVAPGTIDIRSRLRFDADGPYVAVSGGFASSKVVRYRSSEAAEVFLVWGIDGWHPVATELRPSGTRIRAGHMETPMTRRGDRFEAVLAVPQGAKLECGFLITGRRGISNLLSSVWDPACGDTAGRDVIDAVAQVRLGPDDRSVLRLLEASAVLAAVAFLWMLLFGWFRRAALRSRAG
jgi:hypothetical protein